MGSGKAMKLVPGDSLDFNNDAIKHLINDLWFMIGYDF